MIWEVFSTKETKLKIPWPMDPLNQKSLETSKNHFLSVCWEFVFWVFGGFLNDDGLQLEVSLVGANWCGKPWSCHHFTRLVKHLIGGTKLAKDGPGRELKNHHGQNEFHHLDLGELIFLGSAILICGRGALQTHEDQLRVLTMRTEKLPVSRGHLLPMQKRGDR